MKSAAILTFHASHNFGSVLQAYALQTVVHKLTGSGTIINLRTNRQRDLYTVFTRRKGIRYVLKNLTHLLHIHALRKRYRRFEHFIHSNLSLTLQEYHMLEELQGEGQSYEYTICGSDQIWNPRPADFDFAYYLPFVQRGKRIAYAFSFGPLGLTGEKLVQNRIAGYIRRFDNVSVREQTAAY